MHAELFLSRRIVVLPGYTYILYMYIYMYSTLRLCKIFLTRKKSGSVKKKSLFY